MLQTNRNTRRIGAYHIFARLIKKESCRCETKGGTVFVTQYPLFAKHGMKLVYVYVEFYIHGETVSVISRISSHLLEKHRAQ